LLQFKVLPGIEALESSCSSIVLREHAFCGSQGARSLCRLSERRPGARWPRMHAPRDGLIRAEFVEEWRFLGARSSIHKFLIGFGFVELILQRVMMMSSTHSFNY